MSKVKSIPEGMHSVSPHLVCAGAADANDFYKSAFGATEVARVPGPDGKLLHGAVRIEGSVVMLVDDSAVECARPKDVEGFAGHDSCVRPRCRRLRRESGQGRRQGDHAN